MRDMLFDPDLVYVRKAARIAVRSRIVKALSR